MRIFVIRARKASVQADKVLSQVGSEGHIEIVAHTLANAFYVSNNMRADVIVYVVLDSAMDFPRTLKFTAAHGLSFPGFDERAILEVLAAALAKGADIKKDESRNVAPGIEILGWGFEKLMQRLIEDYPVYLLDKKGTDIREVSFGQETVFVLSDHLAMPKNHVKSLERKGLHKISLGKKMLFASQSIVLVHNELDRQCGQ